MIDSLITSAGMGLIVGHCEWLVRRRRIRAMDRVEDPSALVPWRDVEFRKARTVGWSVVGFFVSLLLLLSINRLR